MPSDTVWLKAVAQSHPQSSPSSVPCCGHAGLWQGCVPARSSKTSALTSTSRLCRQGGNLCFHEVRAQLPGMVLTRRR